MTIGLSPGKLRYRAFLVTPAALDVGKNNIILAVHCCKRIAFGTSGGRGRAALQRGLWKEFIKPKKKSLTDVPQGRYHFGNEGETIAAILKAQFINLIKLVLIRPWPGRRAMS